MRNIDNPFYIRNNRAMISLGPLTKEKYCPYSCAFCYVQSGFMKYTEMKIEDIVKFLISNREKYNIIYISGDTDSFAPPRTEKAIELIKKIAESIDVDILFTTRTIFNEETLNKLKKINDYMISKKRKMISCISISRLSSASYIEPYPIPSPEERIKTLMKLKKIGLYTILAVRPFLPIIDANEYIDIIKKARNYVDVVLGESWYADERLIKAVCKNMDIKKIDFTEKTMDFDNNNLVWKCYEATETVNKVTQYCNENNIPFFMRSKPAVEYIRKKNRKNKLDKYSK